MALTDTMGLPIGANNQPTPQQAQAAMTFQVVLPFYQGVLHNLLQTNRMKYQPDTEPTFPASATPQEITSLAWEISRLSLHKIGIELKKEE
jgi:hypothetical protein